ncbi:MAG TPA: histidinol dehydrogenase [Puia sp.]|nr:histidinol dehydrogenase [Puia sp.]
MSLLQIIDNPAKSLWKELMARPVYQAGGLDEAVNKILAEVKSRGDKAVYDYSLQFDKVGLHEPMVAISDLDNAEDQLSEKLKRAIVQAKQNITAFHRNQMISEPYIETVPGIKCWRRSVAIEKVGLYIPGGTAPLFSTLLMLGIPAILAGCNDIIICTPPQKDGSVHPAILYSAKLMGIRKIYRVGGVQAIGAMAYGTETIPAVYKIFGPGNQYVTHAKKLIQLDGVSIDMPAGPSELAVYADPTANPVYVAADLLSQCEHGSDSQVILVTDNREFAEKVNISLKEQIEKLPRKSVAFHALENSKIILMSKREDAMDYLNAYAPEHLILVCSNAEEIADSVRNAGSVFIGNFAPESAGDYASGTNHTLPTNGYARAYSGVSIDSFVKKISFQQLTREGLRSISDSIIEMATTEGLEAHAAAVKIRFMNEGRE